jgi:hypothetical protein
LPNDTLDMLVWYDEDEDGILAIEGNGGRSAAEEEELVLEAETALAIARLLLLRPRDCNSVLGSADAGYDDEVGTSDCFAPRRGGGGGGGMFDNSASAPGNGTLALTFIGGLISRIEISLAR